MTRSSPPAKSPFSRRAAPRLVGFRWLLGIALLLVVLARAWAVLTEDRNEESRQAPATERVLETARPERLASPPPSPTPAAPTPAFPVTSAVVSPPRPVRADSPDAGEPPELLQERARLAELTAQAHDQVEAILEQIRPSAVAKCWPDTPGGGPRLSLTYALSFGRDGGETVRSVNVNGGDVPGEVQTCLRDFPVPPFRIRPADQRIRTEVVVSYP
jgi:hypothetical protein